MSARDMIKPVLCAEPGCAVLIPSTPGSKCAAHLAESDGGKLAPKHRRKRRKAGAL